MPGPQPCHCIPFIFCIVGRGLDPSGGVGNAAPKFLTPANGHGGQGAGRPTPSRELGLQGRDSSLPGCAPILLHNTKKAGANISFAPAVLLLRSHSLITLTRYFSDCTLVFIRIILTLRFCLTLSGSQFTCSLVLPSGSLFAEKHLWNGVKFAVKVIKIVPGVMGLMPRTKAS